MRKMVKRAGAVFLAAAALAAQSVAAQEWPKKQPIKIVVAANAGGGTDVRARLMADVLQRRLGQAVVVENRPGASGMIGADYVAKAAPDGYTVLFTAPEFVALPAMRAQMPYRFDQFTYLAHVVSFQPLMYASPKLNVSTIPELIAHMKANPGKVRYGTTGVGAIVHLGVAAFEAGAGVKGTHVPYTGIAPVYTDLLGGHVDITQATPPAPDGIRVIGVVGTKRSPAYPDFPTLDELGVKNAAWDLWNGFIGPPNMPQPVADRWIAAIEAAMKDPDTLARLIQIKAEPDVVSGDAFRKVALDEHGKWKAIVEREKIPPQ